MMKFILEQESWLEASPPNVDARWRCQLSMILRALKWPQKTSLPNSSPRYSLRSGVVPLKAG